MTSDSAAAPPGPTTVFGLVGGIACGKSTVARLLAGPHGVILDADAEAHRALERPEVRAKLRERFGDGVFDEDGAVHRPSLAARIFGDEAARKAVEGWIHPVVRGTLRAGLRDAAERGVRRIVLDVPLLLEPGAGDDPDGLASECDVIVFVDAPAPLRDQRAVERRGWEPGEVARREALQLSLEEKRRRATVVILNDSGREELEARVAEALARLGHSPPT